MSFWDASAVVPLVVVHEATPRARALVQRLGRPAVWWGTLVECASALGRLHRERKVTAAELSASMRRLNELALRWEEVQPSVRLRETAMRLLRVHSLRAADALQVAAALELGESRPGALKFVCLDRKLGQVGSLEGLHVVEDFGESQAKSA